MKIRYYHQVNEVKFSIILLLSLLNKKLTIYSLSPPYLSIDRSLDEEEILVIA